ncbi:Growth hormone-inducible transmembrane protein [Halotydeus destructor]|nr:Growth hormone-inducible transmembrane protein [Halotydeus destructor]
MLAPLLSIRENRVNPTTLRVTRTDLIRLFNKDARDRAGAFGRRATIKDKLSEPTSGLPFAIGRGLLLGASVFGLAALAFYGAGLGSAESARDRSATWDQLVRDRISSTYKYFGGSLAVTAATAISVFRIPRLLDFAMRYCAFTGCITSIQYKEGFGAKQMTWLLHAATVGFVIAPMALLGGQIMLRAAMMTAGISGGLSFVAASAPSERFLSWGAPLSIGLGAVFASCVAGLYLPPTIAMGATVHSIALYGGLILFGAFLLYDTQKIVKRAEMHPASGVQPFDPVNEPVLSVCKNQVNPTTLKVTRTDLIRLFNNDSRERVGAFGRRARNATIKEKLSEPTTGLPFEIGRGVVLGASAFGLAALAFYGAGFGSAESARDRSATWDQLVRDRISSTYQYFGGSLAVTAATAASVFRNPTLLNFAMRGSMTAMIVSMVAVLGTGMLCQSIQYKEGFGAKQMTWLLHTATIGFMIAPMAFVGGQIMLRAAMMTAGIAGGLSFVAASAPSERFLTWGAPLSIGLGAVFASSVAGMFLPPTTAMGATVHSIALYGGLVLFSAFLLYDTQKIIKRAETHPAYGVQPFDPINASIGIYLDVINIFVRLVTILSGGGNRKR